MCLCELYCFNVKVVVTAGKKKSMYIMILLFFTDVLDVCEEARQVSWTSCGTASFMYVG